MRRAVAVVRQILREDVPLLLRPGSRRNAIIVIWHCRIRGRCICCGVRTPRAGFAAGVCEECLDVQEDPLGKYVEIDGVTYPFSRELA